MDGSFDMAGGHLLPIPRPSRSAGDDDEMAGHLRGPH